jgi:hypothetical protein
MHLSLRANLLFLLSFFLFLIVLSCGKDKPEAAVSRCRASAADTSFQIQERVGIDDSARFFATDTIIASRELVYFTAKDTTADVYQWQIGTDPRTFTGKSVQLMFDAPYGTINIKLTQKRNAGNACLGVLPAERVYTKNLTVVSDASQLPMVGDFYGYNLSHPSQKFTVSILRNGVTNMPFPTGKPYNFQNEVSYGSTAFYLGGRGTYDPDFGAYATSGFGYLKERNRELQIDYSYRMPTATGSTLVKDTFIGVKQ